VFVLLDFPGDADVHQISPVQTSPARPAADRGDGCIF